MWLLTYVGLLVVALLLISSLVLARSSKSHVNRSFAVFTIVTAIWITANYLGANYKSHLFSVYFIHGDLFSGSFLVVTLWFFTVDLLIASEYKGKYLHAQERITTLIFGLTSLVAISTFLKNVIYVNTTTPVSIDYGPLFNIYALWLIILLLSTIMNMVMALRHAKGALKRQLTMMVTGLVAAIIFVTISNLVLPLVDKSPQINLLAGNLSYIGIFLFNVATFYSIIRHKLFDLRLILVRTLAYGLSLTSFTIIYVVAANLVSAHLVKNYDATPRQLIVSIVLVLLLTITIEPIRKFFNKGTNRIFYRDAYDPQAFIDELNRTIIDNIELGILLRRTALIIKQNLKCDFVVFAIFDEANDRMRFIDDLGVAEISNFQDISSLIKNIPAKILNYDDFEYSSSDSDFKNLMAENNISIIGRLNTENRRNQKNSNLLLIGPKKSGNSYNSQDLRIIEIIVNELIISIQNALRFEEIQKFNSTLQEKIDQATKKLRTVNEKLKTLDEAKDDFISMASHQLRTPLTSAKGYLSMVIEGDAGEITEQQHKLLAQAYSSSQRMVYIIADLLNVSRLRTGKFIMEPSPINLADVVEEEVNQLKETAEIHELEVAYDKPPEFPTLMLDETKTRQVIMNYIDNAIYYTPPNGKINVSLTDTGTTIEFKVADNGIGVPSSEKHHLFSKFYRAGNARKARPDGTGLGLFMAKKVIIAQGGAIIFDSTEGKGSTFGFIMSKAKHLPPETQET